jgi:hypothetical protein
MVERYLGTGFTQGESMKSAFLTGCLITLATTSISVDAENYYKWVDRNGVTHYSETKPADISTTVVRIKAANPNTEKFAIPTETTLANKRETSSAEITPQPTEQQLAVQRSNCSKASRKLIAMENAGRVRQLDQQSGEYRYLPNREKLAEISKMRDYLRSNCRSK